MRSGTSPNARPKLVVNDPTLLQPDGEADVRDRAIGVAQQRRRAFQPAGQQVLMRRLAEGATELAAEVRLREARSARELRHIERLAVARVGEVLRAQQMPRRMRGSHRTAHFVIVPPTSVV